MTDLLSYYWSQYSLANTAQQYVAPYPPTPQAIYGVDVVPIPDPKIIELEKKVEELDVINKLGVRWLRKKV